MRKSKFWTVHLPWHPASGNVGTHDPPSLRDDYTFRPQGIAYTNFLSLITKTPLLLLTVICVATVVGVSVERARKIQVPIILPSAIAPVPFLRTALVSVLGSEMNTIHSFNYMVATLHSR